VNLEGVRRVGDPHEFAVRYANEGIDEILYMDAVASLYGRNSLADLVSRTTEAVFVPVTVGGGIRSTDDVRAMMLAGADKVAINTAAVARPELITEVARKFGSQAMVLQIDAKRKGDGWEVYCDGGRQPSGKDAIEWAREGVERGAGEILLTSIDHEGTRRGFDEGLARAVAGGVGVPVVASGGCGNAQHAAAAIKAGADAVAIAHVLHYRLATIEQIKEAMSKAGIPVRPKPKMLDDSTDEIHARIQELKREREAAQKPAEPEYIPQNDYGDCG
jgi:imidazole glycerol-phosphate synthase subunit HisF